MMRKREDRASRPPPIPPSVRLAATLLVLAILALSGAAARAQIVCEVVDGPPGEEVTLHLEILSPQQWETFQTGECELPVTISGTYFVDAPEKLFDFYIVVDTSGSTDGCSQANVNENQILCDQDGGDSIYQAELVAAQRFLEQLDPATARAALITFESTATLQSPLTDIWTVWNTLEALRAGDGAGGTLYVPPLDMMRDQVTSCLDCAGREQLGLFMSDGSPNSTDQIDRAARDLAAIGVVVDTFRLGDFINPDMLILIADVTGGIYYPLATPGEILALLPEIAVQYRLYSRHDGTGSIGTVMWDRLSGTFEAPVLLQAGDNHLVIVLTTLGANPLTLECAVDLRLEVPRPDDVGGALRVARTAARPHHLILSWAGAPPAIPGQDYRVFRSADREGPFRERDRTTDRSVETQLWPLERVSYYDVRAGNCADDVSHDPFPATTEWLSACWAPPSLTPLYPLASNTTDPACFDAVATHPCTPAPPLLAGTDREFVVDVGGLSGGLTASLSNPELYAVVYDSTGACVGWGQERVDVQTGSLGTYTIVVDGPAGSEGPFDLMVRFR